MTADTPGPAGGRWSPRRWHWALAGIVVAAALVAPVAVGVSALSPGMSGGGPLVVSGGVPVVAAPTVAAPGGVAATVPGGVAPQTRYAAWANTVATATGVPAPALVAYAHAQQVLAAEQPGCAVNWATLAGIGRVESNHGRFQGRVLGADGRPDRPIIGIALDGGPDVAAISDTDGGQLDGDRVWDRAVGPMQFIPTTWAQWGTDGDADGVVDPQDIDDAALAAARYLCASGGDLSSGAGWQRAVLTYNASIEYARNVLSGANRYAADSRR